MNIAIKYIIFAYIATLVNVLCQWLSFKVYKGLFSLYIAMIIGTIAGLIMKYILDKRYIFYYNTRDNIDNIKKFIIYSCMGLFTTFIFWGIEIAFDALWTHEISKYAGAVIGLTIGYIVKYRLDKQYVFVKQLC